MKKMLSYLVLASVIICLPSIAKAQDAAAVIAAGKKVKINFSLTVDGQVVETTVGKEPFQYTQGDQTIIQGLQKQLEGAKAGETKNITLSPEQGFGLPNPQAVQEVEKAKIPVEGQKVGAVLTAMGEDGQTLRATVKEIKETMIVVDFNHPLAGKELNFEVEVLEVV